MNSNTQNQSESLKQTIQLKLKEIGERIKINHHAEFKYDNTILEMLAQRCMEIGIYRLDQLIHELVLVNIAKKMIIKENQSEAIKVIAIHANKHSQQLNCAIF